MLSLDRHRLIAAMLGAGAGAMMSYAFGAPLPAALALCVLSGAVAWLLDRSGPVQSVGDPLPLIIPQQSAPAPEVLLAAFPDPLLIVERQRVSAANPAALALLGEHIVGEDVRVAIRHPVAAERLAAPDGALSPHPVELVGLGDLARRFEMTIHPLADDMRLIRLVDRTSSHAVEKMRVDFVANASHELRTPLAAVLGFIETLQDDGAGRDDETRHRFLAIMQDQAVRMQRLINELISLSRIESEKFMLPGTPVALGPLVDEVVRAECMDDAASERIRVAPIADDLVVRGDRTQLAQLLHNLIGNALRYGRAGTPVTVSVTAQRRGMILINVTDEGEGIAPEHIPRLTERFYRVDPGRSRSVGGTGLGLSIVKHIVERHRGQLGIRSEVGVGTSVRVLLPAFQDAV